MKTTASSKKNATATAVPGDESTSDEKKGSTSSMDNISSNRSKTRVCIKQLPATLTEEKLRRHLIKTSPTSLTITDCRILRTKSGKSRNIAYVGFKEANMASTVVDYFHNSYMETNRLFVEHAFLPTTEDSSYRPWSKYSAGSSNYAKLHPKSTATQEKDTTKETNTDTVVLASSKEEEKLLQKKQEFLSVMQPRSKVKVWSNDDDYPTTDVNNNKPPTSPTTILPTTNDSITDDDEPSSKGETHSAKEKGTGNKMSDLEFLRSKVILKDELSEEDDDDHAVKTKTVLAGQTSDDDSSTSSDSTIVTNNKPDNNKEKKHRHLSDSIPSSVPRQPIVVTMEVEQKENLADATTTITTTTNTNLDPTRLFVRNLPFSTTVDDLREAFQPFGTIVDIHIPFDDQKRNKGFAFLQYETADEASAATAKLDGSDFQGRLLHIIAAQKAIVSTADDDTKNFKSRKEAERKTTTTGWSASFVRGDAVVEGLANRLGIQKSDILNVTDGLSGDAAVRLALGETHVIQENMEYFASHGINMVALLQEGEMVKRKRCSTRILVKNLPYSTTQEELMKLFTIADCSPTQILLPPSRAVALVQYSHENEAKQAFRKLAYKRFKNVPLYLEWVPLSALDDNMQTNQTSTVVSDNPNTASMNNKSVVSTEEDDEIDGSMDSSVAHSVYVKNLNFSTNEESLKKMFEKVVPVRSVRIPTKASSILKGASKDTSSNLLSMGFGFVECCNAHDAKAAIKELQGKFLDGHTLELKISSHSSSSSKTEKMAVLSKKTATKLMVRNVPFEATRTELLKLFGSFGQLKKVRLPKKFDGSHRGFAFVDYLSAEDAQNAMMKLSRTHLYGRHLVLEWSEDKDDMETLREKAKRDVQHQERSTTTNKKIRFE